MTITSSTSTSTSAISISSSAKHDNIGCTYILVTKNILEHTSK